MKKAKCKKIEEFESDTDDEEDAIVAEEIEGEEEVGDEEENNDENEGEAIHFEKVPYHRNLFEKLMLSKKRRLLASGLLVDMTQRSLNLYIARVCERFLNDKGGLPTFLKMNYLEQKTGVSDSRSDEDLLLLKKLICGPLKLISLQGSCWECPRYSKVQSLFEHI